MAKDTFNVDYDTDDSNNCRDLETQKNGKENSRIIYFTHVRLLTTLEEKKETQKTHSLMR